MIIFKKILNNPIDSILFILTRTGIRRIIPDKSYIRLLWWLYYGKPINLDNPQTFTEKIQWLKLNDRNPNYTNLVDKFAVKEIVKKIIGAQYIIPTLGVWDNLEDIDWRNLPSKFVLKTTHGGGSQGVIICRDKSSFDIDSAIKRLRKAKKQNAYLKLGEWPYKNIKKRIIAEEFIEEPSITDLADFKLFCFNGEPRYIQVIQDRHTKEIIDFFDTDWNHQEFYGLNPIARPANRPIPRPANLEDMLWIAKKLSHGTEFVRVDLYQTRKGVYFGEITFYPASGFGTFSPADYNYILGKMINLESSKTIVEGGGGKFLIYSELNIIKPISGSIEDYKFFCFNGEPRFLKVDFDRFINHHANYYDLEWNLLPFGEANLPPVESHIEYCPLNFSEMLSICRKLSKGIPFLRVDLYNIAGRVFFGECTFYPASGLNKFTSISADKEIGSFLTLPSNTEIKK